MKHGWLWTLVASCALAACDTPTWVVLRPKCGTDGGGLCSAERDAGGTPAPGLASCEKDAQCSAGELCVLGGCRPCDAKPECPPCDIGSTPVVGSVNGCAVCSCSTMACKSHADCPDQTVCEGFQCVPCAKSSASACPSECPWPSWKAQPFNRNRCALCECAPPSMCTSDADCGAGLQCYRGQQCQEGCNDPSCCFGNFCSQPGCENPPALSCSIVGCAIGPCVGDNACEPAACKCDGKAFECTTDCTSAVCKL